METQQITTELKEAIQSVQEIRTGIDSRLSALEAKGNRPNYGPAGNNNTTGSKVIESDGFTAFRDQKIDRFRVELERKSFLSGTTEYSTDTTLVRPDRWPGIIDPAERVFRIRDLVPQSVTQSNLVEYTRESAVIDNADIQEFEGDLKGETSFEFQLKDATVVTIAHFTRASKQILDDSADLTNYLDRRLLYFLALKEETELLTGDGKLTGILQPGEHVPFDPAGLPATATHIDILAAAQTQLRITDNEPNGIAIHPADWNVIRTLKGDDAHYIAGYPAADTPNQLWGLPVVVTPSIPAGTFLTGDFQRGAVIWDRQPPTIEISRNVNDDFVRNMVTILAEIRIAMAVVRPESFVVGTFDPS